MNANNKGLGQGQDNSDQLALQAAELAVLGEIVSTLGDTISTISALLALEAERQEINNDKKNKEDNKNMQKQIDYLTTELEKLKYQVNKQKPYRK
ncbi:translation initiation factor 2 [Viridibacillus sp. FSL E2-0187]|uniref:translation initiation factor 2 n=1 Tax=Viridibacillus TaxID=496496 RepID=UPI00187B43F8|nr:translation initiation factor 2 [Viridibacillus sp. JNUCC-6]QOV11626.1 translation initiation factor 2 [Viridibacillus sp. JNUCC-6]